jgi:hypothetical protein
MRCREISPPVAALLPLLSSLALVLSLIPLSLGCASRSTTIDGSAPIALEYRIATFALPESALKVGGFRTRECQLGEQTEKLEYVYPSGRRVALSMSRDPGYSLEVSEGAVALHEMPTEDGLQVAAQAILTLDERQTKKVQKYRAKYPGCEFVVFVEGKAADISIGPKGWEDGLPGGRFATLDRAREIYQRPGMTVTVVPESLEVTQWRHEFRLWQAHQARWRFRCEETFRAALKQNYPDTYVRLEAEDQHFVGLSCNERPRPPTRPLR